MLTIEPEIDHCPYEIEDPVLSRIGGTDLIEHPYVDNIYCKMECDNPTRSHKDRLGLGMLKEITESGELKPNQRVIEASSGNMAGGLALAANRLGYPCTIVSPENASAVKIGYVEALGAELLLAPPVGSDHENYYQNMAKKKAKELGAVLINQYERSLNPHVHYSWTGPELWDQIQELGITHIIAATGSGGTISGVGKYVKEKDPNISIIGVDAECSNISRDYFNEPRIDYETTVEGLGQYRTTDAIQFDVIDDIVSVSDEDAFRMAKKASKKYGLLTGVSTGAVLYAAENLANSNNRIVTFVHDGVEQYFNQL